MLYKVTPMIAPPEKKAREPGQPRKKRKSAVFDHEGHEVLISLMCLKCRQIKPLLQFGLRKMADGAIRNQPWCRGCRSGAGAPRPKKEAALEASAPEAVILEAQEAMALPPDAQMPLAAQPVEAFEEAPAHPELAPLPEPEPAPVG